MLTQLSVFIWAVGQGILIAAPVGPMSILCMQATLASGVISGLAVGLGIASADAIYAAVAAFGLGLLITAMQQASYWVAVLGGVVLVLLGWHIARKAGDFSVNCTPIHVGSCAGRTALSVLSLTIATLFLTLANPLTIVMFMSLFAGWAPMQTISDGTAAVVGVFVGSMLWWGILVSVVAMFKRVLPVGFLKGVNVLGGIFLLEFGLYMLFTTLGV